MKLLIYDITNGATVALLTLLYFELVAHGTVCWTNYTTKIKINRHINWL